MQTQVTGLNDRGVTVGFWSGMNNANQVNDNFGFYAADGRFHTVNFPTGNDASPQVDQLLGVNDHDVAVGFYTNAQGSNRGYTYDIRTRTFNRVLVPGAPAGQDQDSGPSLTAAGINNHGDVTGILRGVLRADRRVPAAQLGQVHHARGPRRGHDPGARRERPRRGSRRIHGRQWRQPPDARLHLAACHGFSTVDDPHGSGATIINGVNDAGALVGFYTDAAGHTNGMIALPR